MAVAQVRDALLDGESVQRLQAMRRWVEQPDAPFPPRPLAKDVPLPLGGEVRAARHAPPWAPTRCPLCLAPTRCSLPPRAMLTRLARCAG